MNNFCFITPEKMIKQYPDEAKKFKRYKHLASLPDKLCEVCKQETAWKMAETGMCFSCTTGESDASDDYELIP